MHRRCFFVSLPLAHEQAPPPCPPLLPPLTAVASHDSCTCALLLLLNPEEDIVLFTSCGIDVIKFHAPRCLFDLSESASLSKCKIFFHPVHYLVKHLASDFLFHNESNYVKPSSPEKMTADLCPKEGCKQLKQLHGMY